MNISVIGVDCATDGAKVGVACGQWSHGALRVRRVTLCRDKPPAEVISEWIGDLEKPVLLALDAPLGWPDAMREQLHEHTAGKEIPVHPHAMFRRETDRFIQKSVGKTPLDVGADRIARTAHAALKILGELRRNLDSDILLAWNPQKQADISAIEVYPAATLIVHRILATGYKKSRDVDERKEIVEALRAHLTLPSDDTELRTSADVLDAVVCLLAAKDFLESKAAPPDDKARVEREGWIWCAQRSV